MRFTAAIALTLLGLVLAASAGAASTSTTFVRDGSVVAPRTYTAWLAQFRVPPPPGYVGLSSAPCDDAAAVACMDWTTPLATLHLRGRDVDRRTFAHELGHVFDLYVLGPAGLRDEFAALVGEPTTTLAAQEKFADAYALCAQYAQLPGVWQTSSGLRQTPAGHVKACALIREAYARWSAEPTLQLYGRSPA
jgi:hypothetical protein